MGNKKKLLFLVTEDWYFLSHRLSIALQARKEGFEVIVATRINKGLNELLSHGFKVVPIRMKRSGRNILGELKTLIEIMGIYLREKPDIAHHVAVKPVLYGSLAALVSKKIKCINAIAGLGFVFSRNDNFRTRLLKKIFLAGYRLAFLSHSSHGIFQNKEDRSFFIKHKILTKKRAVLIPGSGVDISKFSEGPEPEGEIVVMLASRMIWDKGIGELVDATRILKSRGIGFKTVLVGIPDKENPNAVPLKILERWNREKIVEWWGFKKNMPEILRRSHIVVLPSYREGLPKGLIEAASCGKPIIAADVPGCREIVHAGKNGWLVPPQNREILADKMEELIKDSCVRNKMGRYSRQMAAKYFTDKIVINKTMRLYRIVLK